jgi:hypothetical protein
MVSEVYEREGAGELQAGKGELQGKEWEQEQITESIFLRAFYGLCLG